MPTPVFARLSAALFALAAAAFAQPEVAPAANHVVFEVASIKPSGPLDPAALISGRAHIGMSVDNFRVDIGSMSLLNLICFAYKLRPYQLTGVPDWAATERFDILAKLPEGASQDQVPEMLQALLAERFKVAVHHDKKEQTIYALVVAKNGPKLKDAAPPPPPAAAEAAAADALKDAESKPAAKGDIVLGSGDQQISIRRAEKGQMMLTTKESGPVRFSVDNGIINMEFERLTMDLLISTLSQYLDRPVVDETGLKGVYQAGLHLSMEDAMKAAGKLGVSAGMMPMAGTPFPRADSPSPVSASDPAGGSLFTSVEQLGLKLEPRKQPYEFLVIDHLEKTPATD